MQLGAGGHFGFMQIAQQLQNCIKRICVLHSFAEHNQEKTGVHPLMQGYLQLLPDQNNDLKGLSGTSPHWLMVK